MSVQGGSQQAEAPSQAEAPPAQSGAGDRGNRRIDRVLSEDYLAGLAGLPMDQVRALRVDAEQEEVDLSYHRRMMQGRIDVLKAELNLRDSTSEATLIDRLAGILGDEQRAPARGSGRYSAVEPTEVDVYRRSGDAMLADVDMSDVSARTTDELARDLRVLIEQEAALSGKRRAVQQVMDRCSAEVARRYRDGEADVNTLLAEQPTE